MRSVIVSLAVLGGLSGCLRDAPDLPAPTRESGLTGQVVALDPVTARLEPVEGAIVHAVGTGSRTQTDARGTFTLPVPVGTWDLSFETSTPPPAPRLARRIAGSRITAEGQLFDLGEIRLSRTGVLVGTALLEGGGTQVPEPGTLVAAAGTRFRGFTDERGRWRIAGLPEGVVDLVAARPEVDSVRVDGVFVLPQIELEVQGLVLRAAPGAEPPPVRGRVLDEGEAPLGGVRIAALREGAAIAGADTDADGRFALTVPTGAYRLRAEAEGRVPVEVEGVVALPGAILGLPEQLVLRTADPMDADGDGTADPLDPDADADGVPNDDDVDPVDPTRGRDQDGDGVADAVDPDRDGDTLDDREELTFGADGWRTDPDRADTDDDGIPDDVDLCPTVRDPDQADANENGRGDACETGLTAVRIDGFEPERAAPGETVRIAGAGLPADPGAVTVRFGTGGVPVRPEVASREALLVRVPERAETGTVAVFLDDRVVRAPVRFCFDPPPALDALVGLVVEAGETVEVIGRRFEAPSCAGPAPPLRLVVTATSGGVLEVPPAGPIEGVRFRGTLRERLAFVLPEGAAAGPAFLRRGDRASAPLALGGDEGSGLRIDAVEPALLGAGDAVAVTGRGFSAGGGAVEVTLPGLAPFDVSPSSDTALRFRVPAPIVDGSLVLRVGSATARFPVAPGERATRLASVEPAAITSSLFGGGPSSVLVRGENLDRVTRVDFGPGSSGPGEIRTRSPIFLEVTVPAAVEPGPITLETPTGSVVGSERLAVVEGERFSWPFAQGFHKAVARVFRADGTEEVVVFDGARRYARFDASTFAAVAPPALVPFDLDGRLTEVVQRPGTNRALAVLGGSTPQVRLVDLDTMSQVGACAESFRPQTARSTGALDPTGDVAFLLDALGREVLRVDLDDGACAVFPLPSEVGAGLGLGATATDEVLVGGADGVFRIRVGPTVTATRISDLDWSSRIVIDPAGELLWGDPSNGSTTSVPIDGAVRPTPTTTVQMFAGGEVVALGRWAFSTRAVLDLERGLAANLGIGIGTGTGRSRTVGHRPATNVTDAWFSFQDDQTGMTLYRVVIRE